MNIDIFLNADLDDDVLHYVPARLKLYFVFNFVGI